MLVLLLTVLDKGGLGAVVVAALIGALEKLEPQALRQHFCLEGSGGMLQGAEERDAKGSRE